MIGSHFFLFLWVFCSVVVFLIAFVWVPMPNNFYHVGKRENKMSISVALGTFFLAWSLLVWPFIILAGYREYIRTQYLFARR